MTEKINNIILPLVKSVLGYSTTIRDILLTERVKSVISDLTDNKGIAIDYSNNEHIMLIVDLTCFQYENKGGGTLPRNLDFRVKNLIIKYRGADNV